MVLEEAAAPASAAAAILDCGISIAVTQDPTAAPSTTSFQEALGHLRLLAQQCHRQGNAIQSLEFADERGWLSATEAEVLRDGRAAEALALAAFVRAHNTIRQHFLPEWMHWLEERCAVIEALASNPERVMLLATLRSEVTQHEVSAALPWAIHLAHVANLSARKTPARL